MRQSEIDKFIQEIKNNATAVFEEDFRVASNEKIILADEIDRYERLVSDINKFNKIQEARKKYKDQGESLIEAIEEWVGQSLDVTENMDDKIAEKDEIEKRADKEYKETFHTSKRGKLRILKTDLIAYRKAQEKKEQILSYQEFCDTHKKFVEEYKEKQKAASGTVDMLKVEIAELEAKEAARIAEKNKPKEEPVVEEKEDEIITTEIDVATKENDNIKSDEQASVDAPIEEELQKVNIEPINENVQPVVDINPVQPTFETVAPEEEKNIESNESISSPVVEQPVPVQPAFETVAPEEEKDVESNENISSPVVEEQAPVQPVFETVAPEEEKDVESNESISSPVVEEQPVPVQPVFETVEPQDSLQESASIEEQKPVETTETPVVATPNVPQMPVFETVVPESELEVPEKVEEQSVLTQDTQPIGVIDLPSPEAPAFETVTPESEINNELQEVSEPLVPDEAIETPEMISPEENKSKKVVKRQKYHWKSDVESKYRVLDGLLHIESEEQHSQNYMNIYLDIANYMGKFKSRTIEENTPILQNIKQKIETMAPNLEPGEESALLTKVERLAIITTKNNEIQNINATDGTSR